MKRILLFLLILHCATGFTQESALSRYAEYVSIHSPEKFYLHVDRTCFCPGETLWFCGYASDASAVSLLPGSGFAYVELLDGAGKPVERVKVRKDRDRFPGRLELPGDLIPGEYTLRGYTLWQLNSPCEYMFNQRVTIVSGKERKQASEVQSTGLDVTFYPEGGRHFAESRSSIAFKAMDRQGRGVDLKGVLVDGNGKSIVEVAAVHDGMGQIGFFPMKGEKYTLVTSDGRRFDLPEPSETGASLGVTHIRGRYVLSFDGNAEGPLDLLVRDASSLRLVASMDFIHGQGSVLVPESAFRDGINHALIADKSGNILSERLFYVGADRPVPFTCTVGEAGAQGFDLDLRDAAGAGMGGRCSVSVVRSSMASHQQDEGIVPYMYLSSELRGRIADPGWYFDESVPSRDRAMALDLLMMVQGWRYYDLPTILAPGEKLDVKVPQRETVQRFSGRIERAASSKVPTGFLFCIFIPKLGYNNFMEIGEGSRFVLDSLDLSENTEILVKVMRNGPGLDYSPRWDGEVFAPEFKYRPACVPGRRDLSELQFSFDTEKTDTLEAAVVSADQVDDDFVDLFDGKTETSQSFEFFKDRTIIDYLKYRMPYFSYSNGYLANTRFIATLKNTSSVEGEDSGVDGEEDRSQEVKLLVDGVLQDWDTYENLLMGNVSAISISTNMNAFYSSPGGMVSLKIKPGASISDIKTESSLLIARPLGYQQPVKYYCPVYDDGTPAFSNTVYWNPCVEFENGKARVEFYDPEGEDGGPYVVHVEGLTSDGRPFSGR